LRQLALVSRFEAWAAEELTGRTDASRAEAARLNRLLSGWFSTISVLVSDATVEIAATPRFRPGERSVDPQARVRLDRAEWARAACRTRRPRLHGTWNDAEILGALRAWSETHGRSPTSMEWVRAGPNQPNSLTVKRHFGSWPRALRRAGLKAHVQEVPPRNYPWTDADVLRALRDWTVEQGRPPEWAEWLRAVPGRPCCKTVCDHFGGWKAGLEAAGLRPT